MTKETWKPVTISGFTGILMGAASAYGVQTVMNKGIPVPEQNGASLSGTGNTPSAESEVASAGDDDFSFKQAFDAARTVMGPGHVFVWRGNLYNTYTIEEWKAMNQQEQEEVVEQVESQLASTEPSEIFNAEEVIVAVEPVVEEDVRVVAQNNVVDDIIKETIAQATIDESTPDESTPDESTSDDDDVRILGQDEMHLANGHMVTVEDLELNGQRVRIIDVDQNGVADLAVSDLNHNNQPDDGEVIDLHTGEAVSFTNDTDEPSEVLTSFEV